MNILRGSLLEITQKDILEDDVGCGDGIMCGACHRFTNVNTRTLVWTRGD